MDLSLLPDGIPYSQQYGDAELLAEAFQPVCEAAACLLLCILIMTFTQLDIGIRCACCSADAALDFEPLAVPSTEMLKAFLAAEVGPSAAPAPEPDADVSSAWG